MKKLNLHLISDSTGETLGAISRAVMSQFNNIETSEYMWSLVRTEARLRQILENVKENGGIVLYTILNEKLLNILLSECRKNRITAIAALDDVINKFSNHIGQKIVQKSGRQHVLDEDYFDRVEAINFTINHDDGQKNEDLDEADIILVGPSRTSKSPTCAYLSHRGFKAANVPFIHGVELPEILFEVKKPYIVGLTINPDILIQIRTNRIKFLNQEIKSDNSYLALDNVREEIIAAKKIYLQQKWPIVDVSRKSIEETAALIIQKYYER